MLTITLTPELEQRIIEQAVEQGTTPELITLDSLNKLYFPAESEALPKDGSMLSDYWADYIGTVDSRETTPEGAKLSEKTGRKFTELMLDKYRSTDK